MLNESKCRVCGGDHIPSPKEPCPALRAAAAQGAEPRGVPLRVYAGYLEAREALKGHAPNNASRVLSWLLEHLAEERGAPADESLAQKLQRLCNDGVLAPHMRSSLFDRAITAGPEQAWALMSLVEHALYRLYIQARPR